MMMSSAARGTRDEQGWSGVGCGDGACFRGLGRRRRWRTEAGAESGGQIDKVRNGDAAIVVQVAISPDRIGFVEVGGEIDEVADTHLAIAIEIAVEEEKVGQIAGGHVIVKYIAYGGGGPRRAGATPPGEVHCACRGKGRRANGGRGEGLS